MERGRRMERDIEPIEAREPPFDPVVGDSARERAQVREVRDEEAAEGADPFFAPTDPVLSAGGRDIIGGFDETSMDAIEVDPSTIDAEPGDEALADAVREELREDALTGQFRLHVEVRRGVVFLHGSLESIEDADAAAEVASRVSGVRQVVDHIATLEV